MGRRGFERPILVSVVVRIGGRTLLLESSRLRVELEEGFLEGDMVCWVVLARCVLVGGDRMGLVGFEQAMRVFSIAILV
jgi:hypothetical protein